MTVVVTGTVVDVTGRKDSREWRAWSPVYREGTGGAVVTYREQDVQVVAGALTARLEPGPCFIQNPDGDRWLVTVPDTDTELWPLIAVAVAIPPGTPADELNAAVTAYFDANPVDVGPEGPPNVLEIGTVVSGPTADATITGTSPTQTLNLTLPKGDKGDPGTPGTSGDWATLTNKPAVIAAGADAATARSVISAQASDSDLTAIAALTPANDDVVQRKSGAWTNRTPAQLKTDLGLTKSDVGLGNVDNTSDVNKPISTATQTALNAKQATSEKNQPNGYAGVDASGTIPASLLPSYVDDVLEYAATGNFPATGEAGKIYVATGTGKIYRWGGSTYVEISPSPGSTDAVPEGATNLYYTNARADARITAALGVSVQAYDADLAAIAALSTTSFGRALLALVDAAALRSVAGLVIGTDVQAFHARLAALAGLAGAADKLPYLTGANTMAVADLSAFARTLLDDPDAATARATLGVSAGTGDASTNTAVSVDGEAVVFSGTGGKTVKRATGTGVAVLNSGVLSANLPKTATIATAETTNTSAYGDLATTTGGSVTVTIGPSGMALVGVSAHISGSAVSTVGYMAFQVSGDSTRAPDDADAVVNRVASSDQKRMTAVKLVTSLTPGANNVFTPKYRAVSGTATFSQRDIFVIPL